MIDDPVPEHNDTRSVRLMPLAVVLLALLVIAQGWQVVSGMTVQSQSWEYLIEGPTDDQLQVRLQSLGAAGWELVSARRATTEREGQTQGIYEMIFRRPGNPGAPSMPTPP